MTTFLLRLRNRHFLALDLTALAVISALALTLRLDGFQAISRYTEGLLTFTLIGLAVCLLIFWRAGLYGRYWRYASVDEIALIVLTVTAATAINTLHPPPHSPPLPLSLSPCRFVAVRFGNVLGSRGSVVQIFREQIARGGPLC